MPSHLLLHIPALNVGGGVRFQRQEFQNSHCLNNNDAEGIDELLLDMARAYNEIALLCSGDQTPF